MAYAQRLFSRQLWRVGRCSLCRRLQPQTEVSPSVPLFVTSRRFLNKTSFQNDFLGESSRGKSIARASFAKAGPGRGDYGPRGGQKVESAHYQDRYQDDEIATEDGPSRRRSGDEAGISGRGGDYGEAGGNKSFRGWGKFSQPSTWGTKTKRVWKSKQAAQTAVDEDVEEDELYPEPSSGAQRSGVQRDWQFESGAGNGAAAREVQDAPGRQQRSVRGPLEQSDGVYPIPAEARSSDERGQQRFGVFESGAGPVSETRQRVPGEPRKKDVIKKVYKRPGSIHTEQDRQPWVKGQPRGEVPQQVYSGLRRQVTGDDGIMEGGKEKMEELSAARDLVWGQQIDFKVYQFTPLGMRVIIRGGYDGLVYNDQMDLYGRERIQIGDIMKGYIFKIRDDNKVDVSLRAFGATQYEVDKAYLEEQLIINGGFIALTSKSSPEEIAAKLQLTKNGFKKAVGGLMKIGRALEKPEGIVLLEEGESGQIDRT